MAGQARYTAVLDACVLYSIAMTDALLSLATAGLFAAKWTTRIEREWMRALEHARPGTYAPGTGGQVGDTSGLHARGGPGLGSPACSVFALALATAGLPNTAERLREAAELI